MQTINERIQTIVDVYFGGNVSAFCRDVGLRQSTLKDILGSRKSKPSNDTFAGLISAKSIKINPNWLLTGEGKMLISEEVDTHGGCQNCAVLQQKIEELKEKNSILTEKLLHQYENNEKLLLQINQVDPATRFSRNGRHKAG